MENVRVKRHCRDVDIDLKLRSMAEDLVVIGGDGVGRFNALAG